jgi:hypothetical protein
MDVLFIMFIQILCNDGNSLLLQIYYYSKTCLKRNLKGPENFSAEAMFPFNQDIL